MAVVCRGEGRHPRGPEPGGPQQAVRPAPYRARVTLGSGVGCPRLVDACDGASEPPKLGAARGAGPSGSGRGHAVYSSALCYLTGSPTLAWSAQADTPRSCL